MITTIIKAITTDGIGTDMMNKTIGWESSKKRNVGEMNLTHSEKDGKEKDIKEKEKDS